MVLVSMDQILREAEERGYGVGAFNVNVGLQADSIFMAAREAESPLIIQISKNALKFADPRILAGTIRMYAEHPDYRHIPAAMHLDHGINFDTVKMAVDLGFSSAMIDGSLLEDGKTKSTYEYNRDLTKRVVDFCRPRGVTIEGEIGPLGGMEDGVGSEDEAGIPTDPDEAKRFAEETGVDALAISVGTSHGAYKFQGTPNIRYDIIDEVRARLPKTPYLVMHGSSSVPKELVDNVNSYGVLNVGRDEHGSFISFMESRDVVKKGKKDLEFGERKVYVENVTAAESKDILQTIANNRRIPYAQGVPIPMIQEAIKHGMRKINIDTDGRMAVTARIFEKLYHEPKEYDPRKYLGPARDELKKWVFEKMNDFGSAGRIADYKPIPFAA
jgi:fructose-bisphosphate aldolase class II